MMKKITYLIFGALLLALAVACNGGNNPKAVTRNFCEAFFVEDDFSKAAGYTTGDAQRQLAEVIDLRNQEGMNSYDTDAIYPELKYHIENVEINGDRAVAAVRLSLKDSGASDFFMDERIGLRKVNGKWFVSEF